MCYVYFLLEGFKFLRASSMKYLTAFNRRYFCPYGILPAFEIKLACKSMSIEVDMIDAPLDYNLLSGRSWTYAMGVISSVVL